MSMEFLSGAVEQVAESLSQAAEEVAESLSPAAEEVAESLSPAVEQVAESLSSAVDGGGSAGGYGGADGSPGGRMPGSAQPADARLRDTGSDTAPLPDSAQPVSGPAPGVPAAEGTSAPPDRALSGETRSPGQAPGGQEQAENTQDPGMRSQPEGTAGIPGTATAAGPANTAPAPERQGPGEAIAREESAGLTGETQPPGTGHEQAAAGPRAAENPGTSPDGSTAAGESDTGDGLPLAGADGAGPEAGEEAGSVQGTERGEPAAGQHAPDDHDPAAGPEDTDGSHDPGDDTAETTGLDGDEGTGENQQAASDHGEPRDENGETGPRNGDGDDSPGKDTTGTAGLGGDEGTGEGQQAAGDHGEPQGENEEAEPQDSETGDPEPGKPGRDGEEDTGDEQQEIDEGGTPRGERQDGKAEPESADPGKPGSDTHEPLSAVESRPAETRQIDNRVSCGDPVDVVTGEMFMTETDTDLPGLLPLLLTRTHISGYRKGRWFGRSWASTLDQRVEISQDGVHYAAPDGAVLHYPWPLADGPMLPAGGARWPLTWDGTSTGEIRIENPYTGVTMVFAAGQARATRGGVTRPVTAVCDRNGHRISFGYTPAGIPRQVRHSAGYQVEVEVASTGGGVRVTRLRLADVTLVSFTYDPRGRLCGVVNSSGRTLAFSYDDQDRITAWTDRNGITYTYTFDGTGKVTAASGPGGVMAIRLRYDPAARTTTVTNSLGHATTYSHNDALQVTQITNPRGDITRFEHDRYDRLLARTDALGHTTRLTRDNHGNVVCIDYPDGASRTITYTALNQPAQVTEPDGATWRFGYDQHGNLLSAADPVNAETTWTYDQHGHLASITDAAGNTRTYTANPAGLITKATDPLKHDTSIDYNSFGRPAAVTDPLGKITRTEYTAEGRPARRTLPDGTCEEWTYDPEGNLVEYRNPAGYATTFEYGPFDLLTARTTPDGARYEFTYDTELRLTRVTSPYGQDWRYAYDDGGHLTSETDFSNRILAYRTDAAGRLTERINGAGERLTYARDQLGRITAITSDQDGTTSFSYDQAGRLTRAASPGSTLHYQRDPLGRITAETIDGHTLTSTYDNLGNRITRTTPGGIHTAWTYHPTGQPATMTGTGGTLTFDYDPAGREIRRHIGPQATLTQQWDSNGRLTSQDLHTHPAASDPAPGGATRQHRGYAYRADGYPTRITDQLRGTRHYDLDPAGRVTVVRAATWTETYAYDLTGNPFHTTLPDAGTPGPHEYSGTPGPRQYSGTLITRAGKTTYQHDPQGRLTRTTRRTLSGQTRQWTYTWNTHDRLTTATTPDGTTWHYTYDPLGRRTAKRRRAPDGTTLEETRFTWDGTRLAEQAATTPATPAPGITTWDWQPGSHQALTQTQHSTTTASQAETDTKFYAIITDLIGTPAELITPDGQLAWHTTTSLWGTTIESPEAETSCPLRFPGQYHDPETGLHYNYHRYYDPDNGHYNSADPLGLAAGPGNYQYPHNPSTRADPLGLMECERSGNPASTGEADNTARLAAEADSSGTLSQVGNFANRRLAFAHYAKHSLGIDLRSPGNPVYIGADMPEFANFSDYLSAARQFMGGGTPDGAMEGLRTGGDLIRLDQKSGYFGSRSSSGIIRTFFRPDGGPNDWLQYFNDQFRL